MERLYEQIQSQGVQTLNNSELLSVLLGEAELPVTDRINLDELNYLIDFGQLSNELSMKLKALIQLCDNMIHPDHPELIATPMDIFGLSEVQEISRAKQENFLGIFLDTQNKVLGVKKVFMGTTDKMLAHPRELFKEAIKYSAYTILCVHNHPCGDTSASKADIAMTERLAEAGSMIGIPLLDHIIIGAGNRWSSMRKDGHFPEKR